MEVEYNGVKFQMSELQSIHRETVWDESNADLLYTRWVIGIVAFYAPNGFPPGTAVKMLRPPAPPPTTGTFLRRLFTPLLFNPFQKFLTILRGTDAAPTPVVLRTDARPDDTGDIPPNPATLVSAGFGPILTDVTLRNRLMTPRGKLKITGADWALDDGKGSDATVVLVESPKPPYRVDPTGGPHPLALDILDGNDMGFSVFFQIETTVLPCDDNSDRLILSHRWNVSHTHDENQYLTRVIDGEVVFNMSMVDQFGLNIDMLRGQLFHPIPLGCYRKVPHVTPSANGSTYTYRIEDVDQTIVFEAGDSGATQIEIQEKVGYYQPWKSRLVS